MTPTASGAAISDPANKYEQNADFWIEIIRGHHDKFRTGLTDAAMFGAIGPVEGLRVLDAGCGEGYLSRELAARGASVLGVDSSQSLIEAAAALVPAGAVSPAFQVQDVSNLRLGNGEFDLIVCNHLINDLSDPAGPIREFARVLRPGGQIAILMLHPCFYGDRASRSDATDQGPGLTYFAPRAVRQKFHVDGITSPEHVTSYHRPLEYYIRTLHDAGLRLTDLQEPHPNADQLLDDPWWQASFPRPLFLLLVARKGDAHPTSGQR